MMKKIFSYVFFTIFFSAEIYSMDKSQTEKHDGIQVAFFNVGQGNCTVIKDPNGQDVWIIDGGSRQKPCNIIYDLSTEYDVRNLALLVSKWIGKPEKLDLHIVFSHPDQDHYNLIPSLRTSLLNKYEKDQSQIHITYHINGWYELADFGFKKIKLTKDEKVQEVEWGKNKEVCYKTVDYKWENNQLKKTENASPTKEAKFSNDGIEIRFINGNTIKSTSETSQTTNSNSLLVKITYKNRSVLLTGDANLKTFEKIKENNIIIGEIDILQVSHHGAQTEGSHSIGFLKETQPRFIIFSAPLYSSYDHPNWHVVQRFAKHFLEHRQPQDHYQLLRISKNLSPLDMRKEEKKFSDLLGQNSKRMFLPILSYRRTETTQEDGERKDENFYAIYLTNYPIFHTGSHGSIIFSWNKEKDISNPEKNLDIKTHDYENISTIDNEEATTFKSPSTSKENFFSDKNIMEKIYNLVERERNIEPLGLKIFLKDAEYFKKNFQENNRFNSLQAIYWEKHLPEDILHDTYEMLENLKNLITFSAEKEKIEKLFNAIDKIRDSGNGLGPEIWEKRFFGLEN